MTKLLLISPPCRAPTHSSLAAGILAALVQANGLAADTLHGSLLYPYEPSRREFWGFFATFLFAPHVHASIDRGALVDAFLRDYGQYARMALAGEDWQEVPSPTQMRARMMLDIERAGVAVERCVEAVGNGGYDIVGFSALFESQILAAIAISQRLKRECPEVRLILGGAACFAEQGDGLAGSFPMFDAVCHSEGERVILPLVEALRGERPLADVPGIAYRNDAGVLQHNHAPPLLTDLDELPVPDYAEYWRRLSSSPWRSLGPPKLHFETSRGCWWGQKHLCTFCGLNAEGRAYRSKSAERAYQEIGALHHRYPGATLQAADNILEMSYFDTVLPRLGPLAAKPKLPLRLFYEIKSNLRRDQIQALVDGGVTEVQVGIEAFSDGVLDLMNKGATALIQVRYLKWAEEAGLRSIYNILLRNPGEEAEWYWESARLLRYIYHLCPPVGIGEMFLERFSPYFQHPERFGIDNIRPKAYYGMAFPDGTADLDRIAYIFDYDHPSVDDKELVAARARYATLLMRWQAAYRPQLLVYRRVDDGVEVIDRRLPDGVVRRVRLTGKAAQVFGYLDKDRPVAALERRFTDLEKPALHALLDALVAHRLVYRDPRGRCLAIVPAERSDDLRAG